MKSLAFLVLLALSCCSNQAKVILTKENLLTEVPDSTFLNDLRIGETFPTKLEDEKLLHKLHLLQNDELLKDKEDIWRGQILENLIDLKRMEMIQLKHMLEEEKVTDLEKLLVDKQIKDIYMMDKTQQMEILPVDVMRRKIVETPIVNDYVPRIGLDRLDTIENYEIPYTRRFWNRIRPSIQFGRPTTLNRFWNRIGTDLNIRDDLPTTLDTTGINRIPTRLWNRFGTRMNVYDTWPVNQKMF